MLTNNFNLKSEKELIEGCIRNNRSCQNQLYNIYATRMMELCLRYARTREDAEDILQEGFVQVFISIKQFKFIGALDAWIKKIFINCALQKLRGKKNKYLLINIEHILETHAIRCTSTDEIDKKILLNCIQNLSLMSRLVFNLYAFEGFKHKEIAALLNISEGSSKSNLFDARSKLKKQLKEFDFTLKKVS